MDEWYAIGTLVLAVVSFANICYLIVLLTRKQ